MAIKRKLDLAELDDQWASFGLSDDFLDFEAVAAKQFKHDERLVKNVDRVGEKIETFEDRIARIKNETKLVDSLLDNLFGEGGAESSFQEEVVSQSDHYCNYCDLTFSSGAVLCNHMLDRHVVSNKKLFYCFACRDGFEKLRDLQDHAEEHCQDSTCPSGKLCTDEHSIEDMVRLKLLCDFCPYADTSIASFQVHCLVCTNNPSNKNYKPTDDGRVCPKCSQVFNSNAYMLKHINQKHSGPNQDEIVKKFQCEDCGRRFVSSLSLAGHKKIHKKETVSHTRSKKIVKPQERALKMNGTPSATPQTNRVAKTNGVLHAKPLPNQTFEIKKSSANERSVNHVPFAFNDASQFDEPVEDMPDLF